MPKSEGGCEYKIVNDNIVTNDNKFLFSFLIIYIIYYFVFIIFMPINNIWLR